MKQALLSLSILLGLAGGAAAQSPCALTLTKSGTGLTRTYTASTAAANPTYSLLVFGSVPGGNGSSVTNSLTVNYTYGGYYTLIAKVNTAGGCHDSLVRIDTVVGPMNCPGNFTLGATQVSGTYGYNFSVPFYPVTAPGYTKTLLFDYGDGTTGTSSYHLYATSQSNTKVKATITFSHPTLPSCVLKDSVYISQNPCNFTLTKTGTGLSRTYTINSTASNPVYELKARIPNPMGPVVVLASSTTNTLTVNYASGGVYEVYAKVQGAFCADSVKMLDTVTGPISCPTNFSLTATPNGSSTYAYYFSLQNYQTSAPGYTQTILFDYGDGTTGSSFFHTYAGPQSNTKVKATVTYSHPTLPSCILMDSVTISQLPNLLQVYVFTDTSAAIPTFTPQVKTWLIKKDNVAGTLTAVDSVITLMNSACKCNTTATFNGFPMGTYTAKSHIINQPAGTVAGYLPTYSNNKAYWSAADTFKYAGSYTTLYKSHLLLPGTPTTGPGFIGGLISAGANKGTAEGDPVAGITVLLRNSTGKVLKMATTGANGKFAFTNIPAGTYTVYPEELNFKTFVSDPIVVSAAQTTLGINFKRNSIDKEYVPGSVLSTGILTASRFAITPNPASNVLQINLGTAAGKTTATLSSITGQVVMQEVINGNSATLSVSSLPAGTYLLQLQNGEEVHTEKVQIVH